MRLFMHSALKKLATPAFLLAAAFAPAAAAPQSAAPPVELRIAADQTLGRVSPLLYGLMTEEINHSYDGGLYAELVRNRNFKEDASSPAYWEAINEGAAKGEISLDKSAPVNAAIPASLRLDIENSKQRGSHARAGIANSGFWGIAVTPNTAYRATIIAKAAPGFNAPLTVELSTATGVVAATAQTAALTSSWKTYSVTLTTAHALPKAPPRAAAAETPDQYRLVVTADHAGTVWFGYVSLLSPTYADRPNGNRADIMRLLADMRPAFLRFPGGNYLEGNTIAARFNWKETLGDVTSRPGHRDDAWDYWSSDGIGLLEFLEWCEDLRMQPVLGVYAGYSLDHSHIATGTDLVPYVQDALDEIEYATGDASTPWGARRAKDGHPAPFSLGYIEIGNEDNFDPQPGGYDARFAQFFDAIKAKYPKIQLIATAPVSQRHADVIDEHYYRSSEDEMAAHANDYDTRRRDNQRGNQKVFVGEWATQVGGPTPNMTAALADAAWLTGIERNSDLIVMASYAPLFVNVNKPALQWQPDLIGYNAYSSYGSPTYYVQSMFANNHGDIILPVAAHNVPFKEWQPFPAQSGARGAGPVRIPMTQQEPEMFFDATKDSTSGVIYVKIVNRSGEAHAVHLTLSGANRIAPSGQS